MQINLIEEGRRKKEEGRRKKEEGRRQKAEGRRQKAEGIPPYPPFERGEVEGKIAYG
ncbi:hypothetical protein [Okeania sp. SIO1I7]|uniref:hypothetical protein n=1 Tax=Okeania sp. SIO1I7 TaxID=2607772 RepID=UPI0013FBA159|nr:hypothetical protein [Okeania sp. SIO1I7]NET29777.1 hypothetical protein [Okeania sp. SIO1I7]